MKAVGLVSDVLFQGLLKAVKHSNAGIFDGLQAQNWDPAYNTYYIADLPSLDSDMLSLQNRSTL